MHEYSLFLSLLKTLEDLLKPYQRPKVESLTLRVGLFSGVDIPYLKEVIETFKEGTLLDGAKINFESEPLRVFCPTCQRESEVWDNRARCPYCQGLEVKITGGLDLYIKTVELEDEEGSED